MSGTGIIIVTYHSAAEIGACLDAAIPTGADIVVVDNASRDSTVEEVKRRGVRLIANADNRGYAAATNQAFSVLNCPYVLLLNPDSVLTTGLEALRETCSLPGVGAAGGQLVNVKGQPEIGFMIRQLPTVRMLVLEALLLNRLWPNNPVNRKYRCLGLDYSLPQPVEQPAGAFLMVRREAWQEIGGFDEGFSPLWFEDVDFCRRMIDRGYMLYYEPRAVAKHTGGHSISSLTLEMRRFYWYRSLLRYSAKHFHPWGLRVVCLAVLMGSVLRSIGESILRRSLKPIAAYGKVVRLASRCLIFGWGDGAVMPEPHF